MVDFELSYSWKTSKGIQQREYRPSIESFIESWQRAESVHGLRSNLHDELQKDPTVAVLRTTLQADHNIRLVAEVTNVHALVSRAGYWRRRGVPLQSLSWTKDVGETHEEKIERFIKLAKDSLVCKQEEQSNG